jgi:predicted HicB family RNase H-like nuclease
MSRVDRYSFAVRQINLDGAPQFEAVVKEFPDIIVYADDSIVALQAARDAVETSLEILDEIGVEAPHAHTRETTYSGRVTLRVPKWLHRALAEGAEEDGCSLNQHIVNGLIEHVGVQRGRKETQEAWKNTERRKTNAPYLRVVSDIAPPSKKWAH